MKRWAFLMALPHGRDISADHVELTIGREFPIRRFVSLCNSLIWATSSALGLAQASFTGRVFVGDNAVDAEWTIDLQGTLEAQGALFLRGFEKPLFHPCGARFSCGTLFHAPGCGLQLHRLNRPPDFWQIANVGEVCP